MTIEERLKRDFARYENKHRWDSNAEEIETLTMTIADKIERHYPSVPLVEIEDEVMAFVS